MNRFLTFIIALLLVNIVAVNFSYSQSKWQFSLTGGYSLPVSDLKGSFADTLARTGGIDFTNQANYLVNKGYNVGITGRYTVDTSGTAIITAGMVYNWFSQTKDYSRPSGLTRTFANKLNIFSFTAGAEYDIQPAKKVNPFIGLELAVNFFSGGIKGSGDTTFTIDRSSETRFGINANAGINIRIKKNFSIIIGAKYCFNNLFGKQHDNVTLTTPGNTDTEQNPGTSSITSLPLNDGGIGALQAKQIIHLQFYAGVSLSFGKVK
jgi:hypothetical protein